ncbi:MAG: acetyl-CoA carboxylase biotin carboxyl carrier protein [Phycisphaerae bacterium]|nr:acetyl-CoA carboxylase biotin carboxyl carrier protein [Phycisphaerae bacterium]
MGHSKNQYDLARIKEVIDLMKDNDLAEIEIKQGDDKILLRRNQPQPAVPSVSYIPQHMPMMASPMAAAVPGDTTLEGTGENLIEIKSPIVGTFYALPSPDADPYVEVGAQVSPQTVVCIVEAMKVMNEIKAEISGTISQICVKSGQAVEYGQVLFRVKPE